MSKRIKIVGNALRVEDTVTSKVDLDRPSKDMWYNSDYLDDGTVLLIEKDGSSNSYIDSFRCSLSDAVDSGDVSFTAETFRTFITDGLGFNIAGSAALKTNEYSDRVVADGGVVESLNCVKRAMKYGVRDNPLLLLTPSGKKATVLYNQIPNNADFTVDRNSPVWAMGKDGVLVETPANVPVFEWEDGCPHLLTQPQATNLITYSNDFSDASWLKRGELILTANNIISPDGSLNGTKLQNISTTGSGDIYILLNGLTDYTLSFYFKKISEVGVLRISNPYTAIRGEWLIDLSNINSDEWIRIDRNSIYVQVIAEFIAGDGGVLFSEFTNSLIDFYIYGAQLEQGSTVTSYIPTNGTQVTRLADNISVTTPNGVTSITETIDNVEQTPITVIPATYTIPEGKINKIVMK